MEERLTIENIDKYEDELQKVNEQIEKKNKLDDKLTFPILAAEVIYFVLYGINFDFSKHIVTTNAPTIIACILPVIAYYAPNYIYEIKKDILECKINNFKDEQCLKNAIINNKIINKHKEIISQAKEFLKTKDIHENILFIPCALMISGILIKIKETNTIESFLKDFLIYFCILKLFFIKEYIPIIIKKYASEKVLKESVPDEQTQLKLTIK